MSKQESSASKVAETFSYTGEKKFRGKLQVLSLANPEARYTGFSFKHITTPENDDCALAQGITISYLDEGAASGFATYFDTDQPKSCLGVYAETAGLSLCAGWGRNVNCQGLKEKAIARGIISGLEGQEGRCWFVTSEECDVSKQPNWIIAEGWLSKGERGRIGVLITKFRNESEVLAPTEPEVANARKVLQSYRGDEPVVRKVANALARSSQLKGVDIAKGFQADLLTIGSPVWVETPEGQAELGATTGELGPTTTAKSQREKYLVNHLHAGKYQTGRQTESGISAGLEKVEGIGWVLKKGLLPSMDLSFAIIDSMPPHFLDSQIESRRDGIVKIQGIKSGELWGRTRLKLLSNPQTPFEDLIYKCSALKMYDARLIARLTFAIYTYAPSTDQRYNSEIQKPTDQELELIDSVKIILRYNLSKETTFQVPLELWPKIMELGKKLEDSYGAEDIPLYVRNLPYKLSLLTYCFALFEAEEESPKEEHVRFAYEWLNELGRELELDQYKQDMKLLNELSSEDYAKISGALEQAIADNIRAAGGEPQDSHIFKLIDYMVKHPSAQLAELEAVLELQRRATIDYVNKLKGYGLVLSSQKGYAFTPKGVRLVKQWLPGMRTIERDALLGKYPPEPMSSKTGAEGQLVSCAVCNKTGSTLNPVVRAGEATVYLHPECEENWKGKL